MMWKNNQLFLEVPLPEAIDGPLIVVHPAAGGNYLASWNVMVEHGQPFVLICDDRNPHFPDIWPYHSDIIGHEYFARIADPVSGGAAYRNPDLDLQNLLVHRPMDGKEGYLSIPVIDILYLDWLEPFTDNNKKSFMDCIALMASRIRDGGIIILDKKHQNACPQWFDYPEEESFEVSEGISLQHLGMGDWPVLSLEITPNSREIAAEVFRVNNNKKLGEADDFLATLMAERRMNVVDLENMKNRVPPRWSGHIDREYWLERYFDNLEMPGVSRLECPYPLVGPWQPDKYRDWVQWLIDRPHHLRPTKRISREYEFGGIKTTIIHGDIVDHVSWLFLKDASLILRNKQLKNCLERCLALKDKAVKLQAKWGLQPIISLKWSGVDATENLTQRLLNLTLSPVAATIVHGDASLAQLQSQLESFEGEVEELIIFHLDKDDYQEESHE